MAFTSGYRPVLVPLYADLDKRSSEVLTKEFPSEKQENKLVWKGDTLSGVNLESTLTQKKDGSVFGTFAPKYRHRPWGTTFSAELNTRREVKAEVKVEDVAGVDGLLTTVTVQEQPNVKALDNQVFATVGLEYHHENLAATASVDFGKTEGSTVKASAVVGSQGVLLGGRVQYHTGTQELQNLDAYLGFRQDDYEVGVVGNVANTDGRQVNEVGVKYFHQVTADLSVGADLTADVQNTSKTPKLQFAGRWNPDKDTAIKAKFDTDGKLGLSLNQKTSQNVRFTVSTTVDANNLAAKQSSQFGFTLNLTY